MKRIILLLLGAGFGLTAFAQTDQGRDLSKYADDKFSADDQYTVAVPYQTVSVKPVKSKKIKNVIVLVGDGMGLEQISVGWTLNGGHLNLDNFPVAGYSRTWASDRLVTDSSAGGTGISSGIKTKYGYICHSKDRHEEADIAAQYIDSGVDFITGGGRQFWDQREDGRNLIREMQAKGYTFVDNDEDLKAVRSGKLLGLFAPLDCPPVLDRGPILEDSAMKAIELLDNKKGFFLMIEGSQIDDWAHRNKVGYMAEEFFEFDRIIGKVLQWAEKDGHTLVIVTADHATGGLTLIDGSLAERNVKVHFSTKGHNGIIVPVFAYGPHAEDFVGVYENAELSRRIRALMK